MEVISPNRVYLHEGDVIPVSCACGHWYTPPPDSEKSTCPKCQKVNDHAEFHTVPELRQ